MENHGSDEYKERVLGSGNKFNLDGGAILIQRSNSAVEFFGICTRERASLQKLCLNHPQILKSFAGYFKKEMRSILAKMESEASSLADLKGDDFYCKDPICPDVASGQRLSFFKGIGCDVERLEKLSQREKECLKFLIDGKTAKETASLLGLSRRTIESYFENIKNKLSCETKQEVFHLGKSFEGMGIL